MRRCVWQCDHSDILVVRTMDGSMMDGYISKKVYVSELAYIRRLKAYIIKHIERVDVDVRCTAQKH